MKLREVGLISRSRWREGGVCGQRNFTGTGGAVSSGRGQAVSGWGTESPSAAWTSELHAAPACLVFHTSLGTSGEEGRLLDMGECSGSLRIRRGGKQVLTESDCEPLIASISPGLSPSIPSCALLPGVPLDLLWEEGGRGGVAFKAKKKMLRVPATLVYLALDNI